jgi:hypothetical protein
MTSVRNGFWKSNGQRRTEQWRGANWLLRGTKITIVDTSVLTDILAYSLDSPTVCPPSRQMSNRLYHLPFDSNFLLLVLLKPLSIFSSPLSLYLLSRLLTSDLLPINDRGNYILSLEELETFDEFQRGCYVTFITIIMKELSRLVKHIRSDVPAECNLNAFLSFGSTVQFRPWPPPWNFSFHFSC